MEPKVLPERNLLNELFEYREGKLFWKVYRKGTSGVGSRAGSFYTKGYRLIRFNYKQFPEHRVIYTMINGDIPNGFRIDHIDTDKANNKIENLRLATNNQNGFNRTKTKNNTSGFKGVCRRGNFWVGQLTFEGKIKYLGIFKTPELAYEAYKKAALELHGEFANF